MSTQRTQQYADHETMLDSPGELALRLYEGAITFCNTAISATRNGESEKAHQNIVKVEKIVEEFRSTLDKSYAVAEELERIYNYLLERLSEADVGKDIIILEEVNRHLCSMRDNWKEVMKAADKP